MDIRMGTLAAQFFNANKKEGSAPRVWHDYFPNVAGGHIAALVAAVTPEEQAERVISMFQAHNERLRRAEAAKKGK